MEVEIVEATDDPEQLACTAARNDYEDRWLGDETFGALMNPISPADHDEIPEEVWRNQPAVTKDTTARMWTLITHLMDHGHWGPFEHPSITFAVKGVSRSLMAQITRHRHVSFDIQSMRYVGFEDANPEPGEAVVQIPELDDPGLCGRNAEFDDRYEEYPDEDILEARRHEYEAAMKRAFKSYRNLIEMGTAPENARMVLPIGTKVNMVFTLNARMLMHVADMRAAADAQWEIREMTEDVLDEFHDWMPMTSTYYDAEFKNRKNRLAP